MYLWKFRLYIIFFFFILPFLLISLFFILYFSLLLIIIPSNIPPILYHIFCIFFIPFLTKKKKIIKFNIIINNKLFSIIIHYLNFTCFMFSFFHCKDISFDISEKDVFVP